MSAPKLRFKEFDKDWNTVNLKNCIESIDSGWSPQCESYPANCSQWGVLKTTSVDWSGFQENANKKLPDHLEPRSEIEVKAYDILVTRAGPTERVGVVSVVPNNVRKKLLISDKLIRIKSGKDNDSNFLGISLSSSKCQNQLQSKTSGLAKSQTNISQKILLDVTLQIPSKAEQTKIASFLSAVDEKISQLTQKHQLLSQYKQGMMQKLFSQQIRFKSDDGSEFGEWEILKFKDVISIKYGKDHKKLKDGNIPVLGTGGIMRYVESYLYDGESILIGRKGTIDKPQFISGKFWTVDTLFYTEIGEKIRPKFAFQQLLLVNWLNLNEATGVPSLNTTSIGNIELKVPCLEEQTKIANFLSSIDQKIEVTAQQIEQAKQWKKGLLQQMFV